MVMRRANSGSWLNLSESTRTMSLECSILRGFARCLARLEQTLLPCRYLKSGKIWPERGAAAARGRAFWLEPQFHESSVRSRMQVEKFGEALSVPLAEERRA